MPFAYLCPFCRQAVQIASQLPVGRPVKCPGCKKLYLAGAPGAVGTAPKPQPGAARGPSPKPVAGAPPGKRRWLSPGWFQAGVKRIGAMGMKQLLASIFFLAMFAVIPSIFAWSEWTVGSAASVEPLVVDLAQLEKSPTPDNNHLKIGPHIACYFNTVYSYTSSRKDRRGPDENTKVDFCFYPIVSTTHPFAQHLRQLEQKYGSMDKIPDNVFPRLSELRVLVKTSRFATVGDIPDDAWRSESAVQGLVINRISTLSSEEQKLIRQDFGNIDFQKVLILSEGRRPSSMLFCLFLASLSLPFWIAFFGMPAAWIFCRVRQG